MTDDPPPPSPQTASPASPENTSLTYTVFKMADMVVKHTE